MVNVSASNADNMLPIKILFGHYLNHMHVSYEFKVKHISASHKRPIHKNMKISRKIKLPLTDEKFIYNYDYPFS